MHGAHDIAPDDDATYQAVCARDERFDGLVFVGVTTTGVYCRPICPARTPARARCRFFRSAAAAERAGFRACFRCRPELAPGHASVDATARLGRVALEHIERGFLNEHGPAELAEALGVSDRHLRRVLASELGVTPVELAQTRRLALAKQLLHDTSLSLADVAFAAGFGSVRRFNALFQARFGRAPSSLRRGGHAAGAGAGPGAGAGAGAGDSEAGVSADTFELRLDYRPPLAWPTLAAFIGARAWPGLEGVTDGVYHRNVFDDAGALVGHVSVRADATRATLRAHLSLSLAPRLADVVARLRRVFDLDAQPRHVAAHLGRDPLLARAFAAHPGLRVPGAFEPFETAVRAVLGQQVSVRAATTLGTRLVERFGPPRAAALAALAPDELRTIGLTRARAETLSSLARAVADGRVALTTHDPAATMAALEALPGIGPWTAQYIAMRGLAWPDAFPAADLGIKRALGAASTRDVTARAEAWRPWRAYAVMALWHLPNEEQT